MKRITKTGISIFVLSLLLLSQAIVAQGADNELNQDDWSGLSNPVTVDLTNPTYLTNWKRFSDTTDLTNIIINAGQFSLKSPLLPFFDTNDTDFNKGKVFDGTKLNGAGNTDVILDVEGRLSLSKILNGILGGGDIKGQVQVGDDIYIIANYGSERKFLKYNIASGIAIDLVPKISSFWGWASSFSAIVYDSTKKEIYLSGYNAFAKYDTVSETATDLYVSSGLSTFWANTYANAMVFGLNNSVLYLATWGGAFAKYDVVSGVATNLRDTAHDRIPFWGTSDAYSLVFDPVNNALYLGGNNSKFARYDPAQDITLTYIAIDLTAKLTSAPVSWSATSIKSLVFDSVSNVIYLGGSNGKFACYNTPFYVTNGLGDPYPASDTVYDITLAISASPVLWGTNQINSLVYYPDSKVVYLAGNNGKIARYNTPRYSFATEDRYPEVNKAYNLNNTTTGLSFWGTNSVNSAIFDSTNYVIYLGGNTGKFASYTAKPNQDIAYDLTPKVNGISWNKNTIKAMVYDAANNDIYLGGLSGKFARYNTVSGIAADLTGISGFSSWGANDIYALAFDPNSNVVYLGGLNGKLARYNTPSYKNPHPLYASNNTVYDLSSKISSFWGTNSVIALLYEYVHNELYIGGGLYRCARYKPQPDTVPTYKADNLNSKLPNGAHSFAFDYENNVLYTYGSGFWRYNTPYYNDVTPPAGDNFTTKDAAVNYYGKIANYDRGSEDTFKVIFDPIHKKVYLGEGLLGSGAYGYLDCYTPAYAGGGIDGSSIELKSKINDYFISNYHNPPAITSFAYDTVNNKLYIGLTRSNSSYSLTDFPNTSGGILACFDPGNDPSAGTMSIYKSIYMLGGGSLDILSVILDPNNNLYLAGSGGNFAISPLPFDTKGSFTSQIYDTGKYPKFATMAWTGNANGLSSLISLKVRASDKNDMSDKTEADWKPVANSGSSISGLVTDGLRYIQYKADFELTDPTTNYLNFPKLSDVTINYNGYPRPPAVGELISSKFDTGVAQTALESLTWDQQGVGTADDVKMQLRTAPDASSLDSALWLGPTSSADYYASSLNGSISPQSINSIQQSGSNARWFQYKVILSTKGAYTPVFQTIKIGYLNRSIASYGVGVSSPHDTGVVWPVTVTAKNSNGNTVTVDSSTQVTVSASPANVIFYNPDNSVNSTGVYTLTNGKVDLTAKTNNPGTYVITVTDAANKTGSAQVTIEAGSTASLTLTDQANSASTPADIVAGAKAAYRITRYDSVAPIPNPATKGIDMVTLSSTSSTGKFLDSAGNVIINGIISIVPGSTGADFWYYDENVGAVAYTIKAQLTPAIFATDTLNVLHDTVDHLLFSNDIANHAAGQSFDLPAIKVVDKFGNAIADYTDTTTMNYNFSGTVNAPDGASSGTDSWVTAVHFTNGVSDTPLTTKLFYAQNNVSITPTATITLTGNPYNLSTTPKSFSITPAAANKLAFKQQPSNKGIINSALAQPPKVVIQDMYGNQTADTYSIDLNASISGTGFSPANGSLSNFTATANNGEALFSGLAYNYPEKIYLYAVKSPLTPAFSSSIDFSVAQTTTVEPVPLAQQILNISINPTDDNINKKFAVLKFIAHDFGEDSKNTLIDRIRIRVAGQKASTDIAWAGLFAGSNQVPAALSIADDSILFGITPNTNGVEDLYALPNGQSIEFTVFIYMKPGKLSAADKGVYTFNINETDIGIDASTGASSAMSASTGQVAQATGTINVVTTYLEVVKADGSSTASVTAGVPLDIIVRAIDANKNVDTDYTLDIHNLKFTGLDPIGANLPKINSKTQAFTSSVPVQFTNGEAAAILEAFNKQTKSLYAQEIGKSYGWYPLVVTVSNSSAAAISLTSGDNQSAKISSQLAQPLKVTVNDQWGNLASGVSVSFTASGPAAATITSPVTTINGQASSNLMLGSAPGTYQVTVVPVGISISPVIFNATAVVPSDLQVVGGNNQSKVVGSVLSSFIVKLVGPGNIPIPNETVYFLIDPSSAGTGSLTPASAVTSSDGTVSTTFTLGNTAGTYLIHASYGSYNADFTATATAAVPYKVALSGPTSAKAAETSLAFTVNIQDQYGNNSNTATSVGFSLATDSLTGGFYSDSAGTIPITNLSTKNSAVFYYKDSAAGNPNITVTWPSVQTLNAGAASSAISIVPADLGSFEVTGSTTAVNAGSSKSITVKAYDAQGNLKSNLAGNVIVNISGLNSSLSPSSKKPTCNGVEFDVATPLTLNFADGQANVTLVPYKAEAVQAKVTSGSVNTPDNKALSFTVTPASADHLKFDTNLPSAQKTAGVLFSFETVLDAVDLYNNLCDYNVASKTVTWSLSGAANGPESGTDMFTNPLNFSHGKSDILSATLYRAQDTSITASIEGLNGVNIASNAITVKPGDIAKLKFSKDPSSSGVTTQPLAIQPKIAISDQYGNAVTSSSAKISLSPVIKSGEIYTVAINGKLSADNLAADTVNGEAVFSGLTYNYPEAIYLQAAVTGYNLTPVYSSQISFNTAGESVISAGSLAVAGVSSMAVSAGTKVDVFDFKITDAGDDGFDTFIKRVMIKRSGVDATGGWKNYLAGVYLTDGTTQLQGIIDNDSLAFGTGNSVIYSVPNKSNKTYTLSIFLKAPLPDGADGKILGFSLDADTDIVLDSLSSQFPATVALTVSPVIQVVATNFALSGSAAMVAGGSNAITIKAIDANGNIDKDYTGQKNLIFSGAQVAPNGTSKPAAADFGGTDKEFGPSSPVAVEFISGNSSSVLKLYKSETANIEVSEGSLITLSGKSLSIKVSSGAAGQLSWQAQPINTAVANAPWKEFSVAVTDSYGNVASSGSIDVTVVAQGASGVTGSKVTASSGVATFYDFAVTCDAYPGSVQIKVTAPGVTETSLSSPVNVAEKYNVKLNVKDYTTGTSLTDCTLEISKDGILALPVMSGSTAFNFTLPYGKYTLKVTKDKYQDEAEEKSADVAADYLDGAYDNNITWTLVSMSLDEAASDYKVQSAFVYDETKDELAIRLWLEKRGKLVMDDSANKLGASTVIVFNDASNAYLKEIAIPSPDSAGTYFLNIPKITAGGGDLKLEAGKVYFAKCKINYGGLTGDARIYEGGTTFTITVTKSLKEVVDAIQGVTTNIVAQTESIKKVVKDEIAGSIKDVIEPKIQELKDDTSKILAATGTESLSQQISNVQEDIVNQVVPQVKSGILNRETAAKSGSTVTVSYQAGTGLSPVINVYDPKNGLRIANGAMKEMAGGGIYQYSVKFDKTWGIGEFNIVCSEATKGSADAMVISVYLHDLEEISSNVSAVLGQTSGMGDMQTAMSTLNALGTQFSLLETTLNKINKDIVGKVVGEVSGAASNLETVYNQLVSISKQVQKLGSSEGVNLDRVYEVSKEKKDDITYLKNKAEELKSAMELSRKMIENTANKPVTQSWLEFR